MKRNIYNKLVALMIFSSMIAGVFIVALVVFVAITGIDINEHSLNFYPLWQKIIFLLLAGLAALSLLIAAFSFFIQGPVKSDSELK